MFFAFRFSAIHWQPDDLFSDPPIEISPDQPICIWVGGYQIQFCNDLFYDIWGGSESKLVCRISPQRIGVVVYVGNSIRRGNPEVLFEPLPISSGVWSDRGCTAVRNRPAP